MAASVAWDGDGNPRSLRSGQALRFGAGGLAHAHRVFLAGCGLPQAWAGQPQWRVLETGFGLGLNFLAAWQAWRVDPQRPQRLHFVSIEAWPAEAGDLLRACDEQPELQPLARQLAAQWQGLTPGFHRLAFEQDRVLLTLAVGEAQAMLREQAFQADSVFLDGFDPACQPDLWSSTTLQAVARLCHRGTGLASGTADGELRRRLASLGFRLEKRAEPAASGGGSLRACYAPEWQVRGLVEQPAVQPGRCIVVGAGLAGAAAAASLARRGWEVEVLDRAEEPAAGASSLPAGLLAPYQSPDDNLLSRLARSGIRLTLQQAQRHLACGSAWDACGVLEHRGSDARPLPAVPGLAPWSRPATPQQLAQAGLPDTTLAWWHENAAWLQPAALVRAWLAQPGIRFRGGCPVHALAAHPGEWQLLDAAGAELGRAPLVLVAAAHASGPLLGGRVRTHPVRGQVSWQLRTPVQAAALPPFPVNGLGHLLPALPLPQGLAWLSGSTYGRGDADPQPRVGDHAANLQRLRGLLPAAAQALAPQFEAGAVRAWSGVRCASSDRRPLAGELAPGLWVSTAMGSRGLSFAVLCAEWIAARLHGEPWPLERRLGRALDATRHAAAEVT